MDDWVFHPKELMDPCTRKRRPIGYRQVTEGQIGALIQTSLSRL